LNGLIGRTISHYTVLEQIGQGGMSSVFRATDLLDQRSVAIKILSPYIAHEERFRARFEREIKLLRRLQHPNIIPILDFGKAEGLTFIVMPYVGNGTLLDRLQQGPLDAAEGERIVGQIASALTLAHQNGVIHRDVKPSNVLIDAAGTALLSDFSFARPQDASQNLTGSALIGTPAYMSPEQCRGDPIDARSDQYSFAVMLFQLTTGQLPFSADTPMGTALQHINVPLPRPRLVNPNLPEEVELVLIKALAKDPALRYESVEAMNTAFRAALQAALHPGRAAAANDKTLNAQRTLALYRKYQNVRPPERRGRYERSVVLATLLLLMACTVSAGAVAAIEPVTDGDVAKPTPKIHLPSMDLGVEDAGKDADQEPISVDSASEVAPADGLPKKKKTRRGTRGGRKRRKPAAGGQSDVARSENGSGDPVAETSEPVEQPAGEASRKAAEAPVVEPVEEPVEEPAEEYVPMSEWIDDFDSRTSVRPRAPKA